MTRPAFIVWFDPGLTTGAAWVDLESTAFGSAEYTAAPIPGTKDDYAHIELEEALTAMCAKHAPRMAVGWERFIETSKNPGREAKYSNDAIAVIKHQARQAGVPMLKPVPSSSRKLGQPAWLRRLGWYAPGKGHANDAAQHLLRWALCQRPISQHIRRTLFPGY